MADFNQSTTDTSDIYFMDAVPDSPGYYLIDCIVAGVSSYIFSVQWIYYCKKFGCESGKKCSRELTEAILLSVVSILTIFTVVFRIIRTEIILEALLLSPLEGGILVSIINFHYAITLVLTYTVIWLRQRMIYSNPALCHISNKLSRFISKYFIVYVVFFAIAVLCAVTATDLHGCSEECYSILTLSSVIVLSAGIQIPLLCLTLMPLYKHRKIAGKLSTSKKPIILMKRITVVTLVCLISDVACVVFYIHFYYPYVTIQANLVVNLVCVTLTPINWRVKLWPCGVSLNQLESRETSVAREESKPIVRSTSGNRKSSNV